MKNKRLLFISNHASFFVSHRLNIFNYSLKKNYEFRLIFGKPASKKMEKIAIRELIKKKIKYLKLSYSNNSFSIMNDLFSFFKILNYIIKYKPDLIHSASPKANLYAGILGKFFNKISIVISFSGMGYLYTEKKINLIFYLKKLIFDSLLYFIFSKKKKRIIVQNKNDYALLKNKFNISQKNILRIKGGSGIDLNKFIKIKRKPTKNVVLISRVLKNKGVIEFFKAAELLKIKYPQWKFIIVGALDYNSPDKVNPNIINYYKKNKIIIFKGFENQISKILSKTEIYCLPSYREGMPKATLEALACGIPVITTNAIGCRESILPNKNGLLCKIRDHKSLAKKIEKLIVNPKLRKKFSINAKKYAKNNFSINEVTSKIFNVYGGLLNE